MENRFIVSARKYRPATFDTVVGQKHITTTLKNAIQNNQLAQSFLFCGPRGVGKTTCARILAKTINCTNRTSDCEACNECDSCESFNNSASFNIYELDAASNNGVDDMRNLVDQVRVPPQGSRYKVYIIDEVHMLSNAAFNAFLKTLEEPPPYAIFILATTEKHKIIPTILSRCQIFDFKRIRVADITTHLQSIAKKEEVQFDDEGLHLIAQKADGALRDALSIFDQTVSFTNRVVTYKNVIENLSILDYDYYFKIVQATGTFNTSDVLLTFNDILNKGFDGHQFVVGLSEHIRNLMVCKDPATLELLEVTEGVKQQYKSQAESYSAILLLKYLGILNDCDTSYKQARNQRLHVELALLRMAYLSAPKKEDADKKKIADETSDAEPEVRKEPVKPNTPAHVIAKTDAVPKPAAGTSMKLGSLHTLRETIKPETGVPEAKNTVTTPDTILKDETMILSGYARFLEHLNDSAKSRIYFILSRSKATWNAEALALSISIPGDYFRQEEFMDFKMEINSFFRKEYNGVTDIIFEKGDHLPQEDRKLYTGKEKLEFMLQKNPAVRSLLEKLNLDLMY